MKRICVFCGSSPGSRREYRAVESYSGRKADERPLRFWLDGSQYQVESVLDQWYDPDSIYYKVHTDDGNVYILRQPEERPDGEWHLVSFRQAG